MPDWLSPEQRVVITGMGAVTPSGLDMPSTWRRVREGQSCIGPITLFDTSRFDVKFAGEVRGFDPLAYMNRKAVRRTDRFVQFALAAAEEAVQQARLDIPEESAYGVGVYMGTGGPGGIWTWTAQQALLAERGPRAVSPMLIPMSVVDSAAVRVGMRFGARGPNMGMVSACSTSLDSVGMALETIRRGDAVVMIAGGSEAAIHPIGVAGFQQMRALSRRNDDPAGASRPFDVDRDGFVMSEGGVVLVLESLSHAEERGAEPIAELRSYAATSDAWHPTAPHATGRGGAQCMFRALEKAQLSPADVGYINAHATGTPIGDVSEAAAIRHILGELTGKVAVSSTKSSTGHLLGGAGALAIALSAVALQEGFLPPTINLSDPDPSCDLNHVANLGREADATVALVPSYGIGGHNSCIVVTKWDA